MYRNETVEKENNQSETHTNNMQKASPALQFMNVLPFKKNNY